MSPKGLILLLVVGLCATQVASTTELSLHDRLRHERGVKELLDAAKEKLALVLVAAEDAAGASLETVRQYIRQLKADVLRSGTDTLFSYGYEVNLTTAAELIRTDLKTCVVDLKLRDPIIDIITELTSCISRDHVALKNLLRNMQDLWETARTMPDTMLKVTNQCSEHAEHDFDETEDSMEALMDHSDHELAPKHNELLEEASKTMSKRALWGYGRVSKCISSVYSLAKSDLMNIPGQIVATAANAFRITRAAAGGMQGCVSFRVTENMPTIISVSADLGTCMAKMDLDEVVEKYPSLSGLRKFVDVAKTLQEFQNDPSRILPVAQSAGSSEEAPSSGYLSYLPSKDTVKTAWNGASYVASYLWGKK